MDIVSKGKLRLAVPESGMKYQSPNRLMHNRRRDKRVASALKAAGYEITPSDITKVLVHMFQVATPIITEARVKQEDLWDALPLVQSQIDWARDLPEAIFFELFVCFIEARCEWEKEPEYPYDRYELYNPAVCELIAFRTAIGDYGPNNTSWILTDAVFFNELARGFDIDEDEDEDIVMSR